MDKHVTEPWQGGSGVQSTRVWAHLAGGAVILADFSVSGSLRHETMVANARRARSSVNFCQGVSTEEIEAMQKRGVDAGKLLRMFALLTAHCAADFPYPERLAPTLAEAQVLLRSIGRVV